MTNAEINRSLNKFRGVNGYTGEISSLAAITHFFLMDCSYDVFNKKVRNLPVRHRARGMVTAMIDAYNSFFTRFFAAFNQEQQDFLIDKADEMEEAIANYTETARIAMMECCNDESLADQQRIADLWLVNNLAYEAQGFHKATWKKAGFKFRGALYTKESSDPDSDRVIKLSMKLAIILYGEGSDVDEKKHKRISLAVAVLTRKIGEWIGENYKQEMENVKREEESEV